MLGVSEMSEDDGLGVSLCNCTVRVRGSVVTHNVGFM